LPAIIGKNCNKNFLKNTYEKLKKNKIVNLWDPDKLYDNFVHVEDLSRFVYSIITKSTKLTQSIVECKSSKPIRLRDTISFMKKKLNSKSKIKINNVVKKTDRFRRVFFSTNSFNFYSSKKAILKFLKENN